jgi:predicted Fe-S protein YdhL (DUF1289 family)
MVKHRVSGVPYEVDLPSEPEIKSPCIEVCEIDFDTKLCYGCHRSRMEIENWFYMSRKDKLQLLETLKEREEYYGKYED